MSDDDDTEGLWRSREAECDPALTDEDAPASQLRPSLASAVSILENDIGGVLGGKLLEFDEMAHRPTLGRRLLEEVDAINLRLEIERRIIITGKRGRTSGLRLSPQDVNDAIVSVASRKSYHPVREYLRGLVWDRKPRLNALPERMQCEPSAINEAILRRFFVAAVARAMRPGCKVDTVLILVGGQGYGKSTFFRVLAGEWFSDTAIDVSSKDSFLALEGAWILEWAELDSMNRRESEAVKGFLTSATDNFRRPYARSIEKLPRSSIIVGSTNAAEFLNDETGARRFWPLKVGKIDIDAIARDRDQLWAESVAAYDADEKWWMSAAESTALTATHERHSVGDAWAGLVLAWVADRDWFTMGDVLAGALSKPTGTWSKSDEMRLAKILVGAGWVRARRGTGREAARGWGRSL